MTKILKASCFWLAIILIIAGFLRFYQITELPPGFYPDEAMYANNGVEAWETGELKVFYPENFGREGLWPNIVGFFVVKFGNEPWIPRAVAAGFGTLTALGVYFLTKELFSNGYEIRKEYEYTNSCIRNKFLFRSETIALLSALFLATSFWHINFSRIAFRAILAPFFLVWAIYFLLKALCQTAEQKDSKFHILNSIFSGLFYGLGFHTYIAYRATPLLILIILLLYWFRTPISKTSDVQNIDGDLGTSDVQKLKRELTRKKFLFSTFYFLFSAIIIAAPLGIYFLKNPQDFFGRTSQISVFNSTTPIKNLAVNTLKTLGMFNFQGDGNWRHNIAHKPLLFWPVGILFIVGICLAAKNLIQNLKIKNQNDDSKFKNDSPQANTKILIFAFSILISWLVIAALPVIVSNEGLPHALRAILMAPPVFILAGAGGVWLYEWTTKYKFITNIRIKNLINIFCIVFLSLLIFEAYSSYFIKWGRNPAVAGNFNQNYVAIGRQLNALPVESPKYVIVKASGADVHGIPMPAQTVMFITDTFTPEKQKAKNIFYVLPEQTDKIPKNSYRIVLE